MRGDEMAQRDISKQIKTVSGYSKKLTIFLFILVFLWGVLFVYTKLTQEDISKQNLDDEEGSAGFLDRLMGRSEKKPQCNDKLDNDGDGFCDFTGCLITKGKDKTNLSADPDCTSYQDNNESRECIPVCQNDADCGTDGYIGETLCGVDGNLHGDYRLYSCNNAGKCDAVCDNKIENRITENCIYGCSGNTCSQNTTNPINPPSNNTIPQNISNQTLPTNTTTTQNNTVTQNNTNPIQGRCSDPDGGKNYNVQGTTLGDYPFTDICIVYANQYGFYLMPFCNLDNDRCSVKEGYCSSSASNSPTTEEHQCPYGCQKGACVEKVTRGCADLDGGVDYFEKGTTKLMSTSEVFTDSCNGNVLTEYSCPSAADDLSYFYPGYTFADSVTTQQYICPGTCQNGACVSAENSQALYALNISKIVSNPFSGVVNLDLVYDDKNDGYIDISYINTQNIFYNRYPSNTIRGAVRLSVGQTGAREVTIYSDSGTTTAYLPQISNIQFTSLRFYIAKDGSSYWALRNHGESGNYQTEIMSLDESFQPQHLARQAP